MKILHYALGFPPYRSGGLTKYCIDLMITQKKLGNEVGLLWPGQINPLSKMIKVHEGKSWEGVQNLELMNMLPVALDEGIINVNAYTSSRNVEYCRKFLDQNRPDIIHIHTLMGLPVELLQLFKELGIPMIFTTHDYFGLCPTVTFYKQGSVCENNSQCEYCYQCNKQALSIKKIIILQSKLYRKLKNHKMVTLLRQKHRRKFFKEATKYDYTEHEEIGKFSEKYNALRQYYLKMLSLVDFVHYNSSVTKSIYERYVTFHRSEIISISHNDIHDQRKLKDFNHKKLRMTYLGPPKAYKGYCALLRVLDKLYSEGFQNFELSCYSKGVQEREYISNIQNGYTYSELEGIFDRTDLLLVPSQWYETFGFTVLEALSYGVPVFVSEKVGAKDLLKNLENKIFSEDSIRKLLQNENWKDVLSKYNKEICTQYQIKTGNDHGAEMIEVYRSIIKNENCNVWA